VVLASAAFSVANIEAYARLVAADGEKRRVRQAGKRIALAESYAEGQMILAEVRPNQTSRVKTAADGLREMVDALQLRFQADGPVTGTPTGLASLDALTGGWQPGDLVAIAGRTSSGKTAFALQAALTAGRTFYASLEMTAAQLMERAVCNLGHIPAKWLKFPKDAPDEAMPRVVAVSAQVKSCGLRIDDQPALTFDQIASRIRQVHMAEPLKLAVVDHLKLVRTAGKRNSTEELGEVSNNLKALAKDLGIPILVLVQLNRSAGSERPKLEHLRASGEIEEALDTAVMVHREEYHNTDSPLAGYAELIVAKQRQGERNVTAWARSVLSEMRFESCDEPDRPAASAGQAGRTGGFKARYGARPDPRGVSHGD
jgi:replicative DNA helicase